MESLGAEYLASLREKEVEETHTDVVRRSDPKEPSNIEFEDGLSPTVYPEEVCQQITRKEEEDVDAPGPEALDDAKAKRGIPPGKGPRMVDDDSRRSDSPKCLNGRVPFSVFWG
jgi:hypothetical protein